MSDTAKIINDAIEKGIDYFSKEDYINAYNIFRKLLKINPDSTICKHFIGMIHHRKKNYSIAKKFFEDVLKETPNDCNALNNMALIYLDLCKVNKSISVFKKAIKINPEYIPAKTNLGLAYEIQGNYQKAIDIYNNALSICPDNAEIITSISHSYACMGKYKQAKKYCNLVLEKCPDNPKAHFNLALLSGLDGKWKECFSEMEWRWKTFKTMETIKDRPRWNGADSLKDKKILVYSEQATGDLFQFSRYIPRLKELGAYVILECSWESRALLSNIDGVDIVRDKVNREYDFDYYVSAISLPNIFGLHPIAQNYIKPVRSSLDWNNYSNVLKIGVVWAGGPAHTNDRHRSFNCELLSGICKVDGVKIFSLQKDIEMRYWSHVGVVDLCKGSKGISMVDMRPYMNSFANTASVISELDLVISVDTAVAHLAGAMGKPTWLLLSKICDWRWKARGSKTMWYDSFRIFRQKTLGDWQEVLQRIENEVINMAK